MLDADHCDHRNPPFHLPNNVVPQCAKSHSNNSSGIFSSCLTCTFMLGFPATQTDLSATRDLKWAGWPLDHKVSADCT